MSAGIEEYRSRLRDALGTINQLKARLDAFSKARSEPIAIIGMACRLPGGGRSPEAYFQALEEGRDGVTEVPSDRWLMGPMPDDPAARGVRWGAFVDQVDQFDATFFGISPREASHLDPQQRLLLELGWEALERAGIVPTDLVGSRTGVFLGFMTNDYALLNAELGRDQQDAYSATGNGHCFPAGRLSYTLGLQGPSFVVDTACSSSLVATHLACGSLRSKESDLALVGGVNLMLSPETPELFSKTRALSPDGHCKTFDAAANGYVRGEGCGVLVLKRLSDAVRDKDPILALVRGSAVNQDGRSTGLTTPNVLAQEALIRTALENAGVAAASIRYVETHGTGTPLGDPIEVDALRAVLGDLRADGSKCVLGAVKTNIGHLEAAAGIASLVKTIMVLQRRQIPRNIHFRAQNPRIELEDSALMLATEALRLERGAGPLRAGVSAFGMSGTNAHVILEEAPPDEVKPAQEAACYLLPLSAKSPKALIAMAKSYSEWLSGPTAISLPDFVYTASVRRAHLEQRLAVTFSTREEAADRLAAYARGESPSGVSEGKSSTQGRLKVIFVFPGQGSQWLGMGRDLLLHEPAFRNAIEACDAEIRAAGGFSILAELSADEARSRLHEIDVVQPVLFAIEVALASLWRAYGIEPDCVVGHSMGEVAAAHVAGLLSLADAATIICRRSRLLRGISGNGAMAFVELPMAEAQRAIAAHSTVLSVAVSNGPRSTVLSGDGAALEAVLATLEAQGIFCRRVKVDVASHSPQVEPLRAELLDALRDIRPLAGTISMRSTVTGGLLHGGDLSPSYWWDNLRQPVQFSQVTQDLLKENHTIFVEISPHPILLASIEENLKATKVDGAAIPSIRRQADGLRSMLDSLGVLYVRGYPLAWSKRFPAGGRVVSLPAYAWQRQRYWVDSKPQQSQSSVRHEEGGHPLLGLGFVASIQPELHVWQQWLSVAAFSFLADHRVQGLVVFPGAGYIEMALAAGARVYGDAAARLESMSFEQMLVLPEDGECEVQVSLLEEGGGRAALTITSRSADSKDWTKHASGVLRVVATSAARPGIERHEELQARCSAVVERQTHYDRMTARGLLYGKHFQGVERIFVGKDEWLGRVRLPESEGAQGGYILHPALLDACFQSSMGLLESTLGEGTFVPVKVSGIRVFEHPKGDVWVHGRLVANAGAKAPSISMVLRDDAGNVLVEVGELMLQGLADTKAQAPFADCLFEVLWQKKPRAVLPESKASGASEWLVLLDAHGVGLRVVELLRMRGDRCVEVLAGEGYSRLNEDQYRVDTASPEQWDRLLNDAFGKRTLRGALHCAALDGARFGETTESTITSDLRAGVLTAMRLGQALLRQGYRDTPKLYLLTRGAQAVGERNFPVSVSQSTLWGFGRAVAIEQPELACVRIDLGWEPRLGEAEELLGELLVETDEDQVALRPEGRYVARLVRGQWDRSAVERGEPARGRPYRLEIREPGVLEKLALRPMERRPPGPGEVEIEVEAAGLNFLDVMKAMGIYPGMDRNAIRLGGECAGRIVGVGEGVTGLVVGQEVIASAPSSFATHVTTRAAFVVNKPERMSFEEGASILGVFTKVYWALHHAGRLRRGERILIHAATGGTGLAAIQYARAVGAEIYATAGSERKRALLRSMGIEHVMDSRSVSFADEILSQTGGRGVDVVLNSLSGDGWSESLRVLGPYGRFLDLSKKDIYQNSRLNILEFRKCLTYTAIDLAGLAEEKPDLFAELLSDVMKSFENGTFQPESLHVFSAAAASDAFRLMAQARHVGKIVVRMKDPEAEVVVSAERPPISIRLDATYLITGGLGGLGLTLAEWFVERGAKSVALMGRSAPNEVARAAIQRMQDVGAAVHVIRADVSRRADVDAAIAEVNRDMLPLRGIVHAAAVLEDHTLPEMSEEQLFRPMLPKVLGGFFLHDATRAHNLDFFVMYSSAAGLLGSPGQSNYAAANTFLDALCQARVADGLAATSIQWGAFSEVGLAASSAIRGQRMAARGIASLDPQEGNELFARVLEHPRAQLGILRLHARQWVEFNPQLAGAPYLSVLVQEGEGSLGGVNEASFREVLERARSADLRALLEGHLVEQLGRVLRIDPARLDRAAPFSTLGMDSLMSLELRNRLEAGLGLKLSAALLFTYATTTALASYLLERLFPASAPEQQAAAVEPLSFDEHAPAASLDADGMQSADNEESLVSKLDAFEEYLK